MEEITDADYIQNKRIFKDFEIESLGEYHDFSAQSHMLLLSDLFEIKISFLKYMSLILKNFFQLLPFPGTSPEGPLKVLTSGTFMGPSGDS